ncbi:40S ribosomal protein S3 [Fusarium oxysporum f. sp. phaseoli]
MCDHWNPLARFRAQPHTKKLSETANLSLQPANPQLANRLKTRHQVKSSPDNTSPIFKMAHPGSQISKRRKFVADGVFYAELNEFFQRELAEEGYSGVEVRVTPTVTDIIIRATHTQEVLGEQGRRIRELTSLIQKRFKFPENSVSLYAAKVQNRGLSAVAQCESLRYKLLNGLAVRRACYGVLRFIMESGAKGCEVVVSGKLRAARAKSMKFTDGFMIHSGQPAKDFIDHATRHVLLRQGVLGIKVKIMRGSDPEGKAGPQKTLPDAVTIIEPKEEQAVLQPVSQDYGAKAAQAAQAAQDARVAEEEGGDEVQAVEQ